MRVVSNERIVRRETRIAGVLMGLTFLVMGVGIVLVLQVDRTPENQRPDTLLPTLVVYAVAIVGFGLSQLFNARMRRFGPRFRQEPRLSQLLRGLGDSFVLYAFTRRSLPDYILVGPTGVYVLTTRMQKGEITCSGDRWRRKSGVLGRILGPLYGNPLGTPSWDNQKGVAQVKELLNSELPTEAAKEVPVQGLIVFTDAQVRLRVDRCTVPATTARELRRVVSRAKSRLSSARVAEVRAVFDGLMSA